MSGKARFVATMGAPAPAVPPALHFTDAWSLHVWSSMHEQIGSGWYMDRFFFLFGEGLETLTPCLEAWSFLAPPEAERMILGRNAYGALFVLERPNEFGPDSRVRLLDPVTVRYHRNAHMDFAGLIGNVLPNKSLPPSVQDTRVYTEWTRRLGRPLELDEILGIKVPLTLGGKMEPDNFMVENIVRYYRTTAPIYEKAHAQLAAQRGDDKDKSSR